MKYCNECKNNKPLKDFHKRAAAKDGHQPICKLCKKERDAKRFKADPSRYQASKDRYKKEYREWLNSLKNKPCTDCNKQFHFSAMHWDHLPKYEKSFNLGSCRSGKYSKQRILKEIAKCELVCANCHAIRTYNRSE